MKKKVERRLATIELAGARVPSCCCPKRLLPGYSLGSYVALQTAVADQRIKCVVVAAGGDLPTTPWTRMLRMVSDPLASAKSLTGRPLLMLHGTQDRTIPRDQAQRLYDAASEPKELRWYDSGHALPPAAADDAAAWLARCFGI